MRVKCDYEDFDGDRCRFRGEDGYCVKEEIVIALDSIYPVCQDEDRSFCDGEKVA